MAESLSPSRHIGAVGAQELPQLVGGSRDSLASSSGHGLRLQRRVSVSRPSLLPCLRRKSGVDHRHKHTTITAVGTSKWKDPVSDPEIRLPEGITSIPSLIPSWRKKDENRSNKQKVVVRRSLINWAALFCDFLEKMIYETAKGSTSKQEWNYYLSASFAPVSERAPTTALRIIGTIPECMFGEFFRVGPNPRFEALGGYHWFDGDGMIHGLHLSEGKATYVVRYVRTSRLQQEERYGAPKFWKVGDMKGVKGYFCIALENLRRSLGVLNVSSGYAGTGNTSLVFHNKKLLALHERDKPYRIKVLEDGDLVTVGLEDFDKRLQHSFAAHPKIDPVTGEMFFFGYHSESSDLIYRTVSKEGVLRDPVLIKLPTTTITHDFAITENYAILMDLPLVLDPLGMAQGGFIFRFDPNKESRLGVLPRYATDDSQIRWFTIPTCYILHTVAAWEEEDEIILICCRTDGIDLNPDFGVERKNKAYGDSYGSPTLYEYRMNFKNGHVHQRQLSNLSIEFPTINPHYVGRKTRYTYCGVVDNELDLMSGIVNYDLYLDPSTTDTAVDDKTKGNNCTVFHFGPNCYASDTIFVPNNRGMANDAAEDDGFLISFVQDLNTGKSEAIIIDAKTMGPTPVAVVELPGRIPKGFHAYFVTQEQLQQQA